jgi:hypothetical protein
MYAKYKSPGVFIAARDFCTITHWSVQPDGSVIMFAKTMDHPKVPPVSGD